MATFRRTTLVGNQFATLKAATGEVGEVLAGDATASIPALMAQVWAWLD